MPSASHISEKDLIRFADGETDGKAAAAIEAHLEACARCRARRHELESAVAAYTEYHSQVLKPSLASEREWPRLQPLLANLDQSKNRFGVRSEAWWAAAVLACCLVLLALFLYRDTAHRSMRQLLARAAAVPTSPHRRLQVTLNARSWYRPAVLRGAATQEAGLEHTRALFVKANYSWDDPLSARSFAAWRNRLRDKRDQVLSIQDGDGRKRFYRLRTETSQGTLRMASLTLRADTLGPVKGAFHFEDQEEVTMADAGEMPAAQPRMAAKKSSPPHETAVESTVSPEEELRVFAALNAIGADVGEPLTVDFDPSKRHIVVSGVGIPNDRERQIRQALAQIPNTTMHFDSGQPFSAGTAAVAPDTYSTGASAPLRHTMESQAGGAQQFQSIADRALDASASLLAQAHALYVLSQKFPPAIESAFGVADRKTLRALRHRHAAAIEQATLQLGEALKPLLVSPAKQQNGSGETRKESDTSWQHGAAQLLKQSRLLDESLSRLLAGSYSQKTGEEILSRLPDEIQNTEALAHAEDIAP